MSIDAMPSAWLICRSAVSKKPLSASRASVGCTHLSLKKDAPIPRDAQRVGRVLALPILGGLHHRYVRV
jgi:hypothetical protein